MRTFEELLALANGLAVPDEGNQRTVEWCGGGRVLGLAREQGGGFEVFIRGGRLRPQLALVAHHLRHDEWQVEGGEPFEANRIVLPADSHFMAVAAFLAEELLRSGVGNSPQNAFAEAEPLIEMALRRTALDEDTSLGLLGELRFLELLLEAASTPEQRAVSLEAWRGYERASRDFVIPGGTEIEVKVTRGARSSHHVSSIAQVDPRRSAHGDPLEQLYLLSIGMQAYGPGGGGSGEAVSVPTQVDAVLQLLGPHLEAGRRNEIQELFLAKVQGYGSGSRAGYDHDEMRSWAAYETPWVRRFERVYDMNDDEVEVLRRADVEQRPLVSAETVRFVIELPDTLGEDNPRSDVPGFAADILR